MYRTLARHHFAHARVRALCALLALVCLALALSTPAAPRAPAAVAAVRQASVSCATSALPSTAGLTLPICTTASLTQRNESIRRAIIVVAPAETNTGGSVPGAASLAGLAGETIVVAPTFREAPSDPNVLYWGGGWRFGDLSVNGPGVSSFQIVDDLVDQLADPALFPNLQYLVVTGFSAGGQFTNRYAAFSPKQQQIEQLTNYRIRFRYVVGAPSIYVYMDPYRWDPAAQAFGLPSDPACTGDWYPYGLVRTGIGGAYLGGVSDEQVRTQYALRQVFYLVGAEDNQRDAALVTSCEADLQGMNRLERAQLYQRHIAFFFGASAPLHSLVVVPGIGHSDAVYTSALGLPTLFDNWPTAPNHRIAGRVLDEAGRPVAGVTVSAGGGLTSVTDGSGSFLFQGLAAGGYTVTPSASGGARFSPPTRTATVPQSVGEQNFTLVMPRVEPLYWASNEPLVLRSGSALFIAAANFPPSASATISVGGQTIGVMAIDALGSGQAELILHTPTAPGAYILTLTSGESVARLVFWLDEGAGSSFYPSGGPALAVPQGIAPARQIFLPLVRR
jgi:Carboxypeptidase regulatory-like domain